MTDDKWDSVARLLKDERVSNDEAARRCRVRKRFVARVRADLGLPAYTRRAKVWTRTEYDALSVPLRGGHRRWRGRVSRDGVPMVSRDMSAYRLAFRLHFEREPVGRVQGTCSVSRCVEGAHQQDAVMRAKAEVLTDLPSGATYHGLDLVAVRRCLHGTAPYPPLLLAEARLAFRFAGPSVSAPELADRLNVTVRTIERWKKSGAPPW